MEHDEILQFILDERKRQKYGFEELEEKAGVSVRHLVAVLHKRVTSTGKGLAQRNTAGLSYIMKILDALDLKLVIEDKDANWGEDMSRLRMMPKKLYVAERIESREMVKKEGFYPRVDLFDNIDSVLKFVPKPCDIYEIYIGKLIRKKFDVNDHPYGIMYSYNEWIGPENIKNMTTYR